MSQTNGGDGHFPPFFIFTMKKKYNMTAELEQGRAGWYEGTTYEERLKRNYREGTKQVEDPQEELERLVNLCEFQPRHNRGVEG